MFQRSQLAELASIDSESWAKESSEIETKIAYRNGGGIESEGRESGLHDDRSGSRAFCGIRCGASRIADRRMMLAGYCTLLFDDGAFCFHIYQMLTGRCGKSVRQIGAIDLRYTP
jgi:hypothetical protein